MASAVQFGAGNIGRGFLAQLFTESGLDVVFVDVVDAVVDALNKRGSYPLHIVGDAPETISIKNVRAVLGGDRVQVSAEISKAAIVCTAVGAAALPYIASAIAAGLLARTEAGGGPVNILICENLHDAPQRLRELVSDCLPTALRGDILASTGFVHAVVSRMVPVQTAEDRAADILAVRAEAYKRLPVDAKAIVGSLPALIGVEPTTSFAALEARKLYMHNCAHAVLGYLGWMAGHNYGYEALEDVRIGALLRAVLAETSQALVRRYGFAPQEQADHIIDLLSRFRNKALGDTCVRLARDPLRKLAPGDRLIGAARLCEEQGVEPRALAWAIVAALRYDVADDPSACEVQRLLKSAGLDAALAQIAGIQRGERLAELIREAFDATEPPDWKSA